MNILMILSMRNVVHIIDICFSLRSAVEPAEPMGVASHHKLREKLNKHLSETKGH